MSRRAVFFDRDGVLNADLGYVGTVERFSWCDGAIEAVQRLNRAGWLAIVVTNQSGVARGYYTLADVDALHTWMNGELLLHGAWIDAFYRCPFHDDALLSEYRVANHPDRKPNPGMILQAIADHGIDPGGSYLLGDSESDISAATAAGVKGILVTEKGLVNLVDDIINN